MQHVNDRLVDWASKVEEYQRDGGDYPNFGGMAGWDCWIVDY